MLSDIALYVTYLHMCNTSGIIFERIKMPKRGGELGFSKKFKQPISSNSTPCA